MNVYMSDQKIPIQTNPSKGAESAETFTYHHPLSSYISWATKNNLALTGMEEWISDKTSEGGRARAEDRARKEFPFFLALLFRKLP